jgi:NADP-dependent 3-hydroxy acid dehydrogenase YdfG
VQADVTKVEEIERAVAAAVEKFGKLDIVFANAGIPGATPVGNTSLAAFEEDSYEYALDEETDGRRASEFLIAKGIIENPKVNVQLSKAAEEDRRTPEQRAVDAKKKALTDLVSIVIDRTEVYGSPIDTSSEQSVREHVIELHPVGEGKKR